MAAQPERAASGKSLILLVEDTPSLAQLYAEYVKREPYALTVAETGQAARDALSRRVPTVVLLDLQLPDMNGLDILRHIRTQQMPTEVIVMTAHGSISVAVEAMRHGAFDFLIKPFNAERLIVTLRNAVERRRLATIVDTYREEFDRDQYCGFVGASLPMQAVYRIIESAGPSKATIFVTGESGTGKEVCAEAIHRRSPRAAKPFIAVNCAAIPRELMESEIFGHVKGAFTGATSDHDGAVLQANSGTLFLDEICEMDLNLQAKLLRFLQTGEVQKVGGTRPAMVDVRIVCATNRDPLAEVKAGRFREDLFYRLHVIPIELPPLRDRETDVLLIARHFLTRFATEEKKPFKRFSSKAEAAIRTYSWPGNIRQLQNVIRNVVVLHNSETVELEMLPPPLGIIAQPEVASGHTPAQSAELSAIPPTRPDGAARTQQPSEIRPLWKVEKEAIESAIAACEGNIPRAAAMLGISPSTVYRKRQSWEGTEKV
ncbi:MAG: sigma-54-dependent Fis family transcriptional regulator [Rhodospirillales bacterium]|nr:sigma-54-dependent Fis family transcriptional regulator [Rhodospirillales bacterium]